MTAQAMVNTLVYFLLFLWGTSVVLLLVAMMGYNLPWLRFGGSKRQRPAERSLRLVHFRPDFIRVPAASVDTVGRRPSSPRRPAVPRRRPTHLRVVGL